MNDFRLKDLDELLLVVRDQNSKGYIQEAILAHRAGAFRAAVVATWIAVVYDLIAKIKELAELDYPAAKIFVKELDAAISSKDIPKLQTIERELLKTCKDSFQFFIESEYSDLEHLQKIRNYCAHPAYSGDGSLYEPTSEEVRTQIVHAVSYVLQHAPSQGNIALEQVISKVKSITFSTDFSSALVQLSNTAIGSRPRRRLIKDFIFYLLNELLLKTRKQEFYEQYKTALLVVMSIHKTVFFEICRELIKKMLIKDAEHKIVNMIFLLEVLPQLWDVVEEPFKIDIIIFIEKSTPLNFDVLKPAALVKPLIRAVEKRLKTVTVDELEKLLDDCDPQFDNFAVLCNRAIEIYGSAKSIDESNLYTKKLIAPFSWFMGDLLHYLFETANGNQHIKDSEGFKNMVKNLPLAPDHITYLLEKHNLSL